MVFLDCGKGDAVLMRTPGNKCVLLDAGKPEAGKKSVVPFLQQTGVNKIDVAVFSHPHQDHVGGFLSVLDTFEVGLIMRGETNVHPSQKQQLSEWEVYDQVLEKVQSKGIPIVIIEGRNDMVLGPQLEVVIFGPFKDQLWGNVNDSSLVFQVRHGKVRFLLTGDIGKTSEKCYVERYQYDLKSHVLKVPHHGLNDASSLFFIRHVQPETAVISCGYSTLYKTPSEAVVERYEKENTRVLRTDRDGNVTIVSDGETYEVVKQQNKENTVRDRQ